MTGSLADVEFVLGSLTQTVLDNETYFGDLDAVVGDGDFGYSLAKVAMTISARIGGTSGPIWGTAMLRLGSALKGSETFAAADVIAGLRKAIEGIQARGKAELGDKTLLDSLVPAVDTLEQQVAAGASASDAVVAMAATARQAADDTAKLQARRGRASYTGERSIGSVDAGATAIAVILEKLVQDYQSR